MRNRFQQGFTLIELMIVVVVIGILAAIALPSYAEYIKRSHRTDGKSALLSTSQTMERYFTENSKYSGATLGAQSTDLAPTASSEKLYVISFDSAPTGATVCGSTSTTSPSPSAYRLCATPTGSQASDTKCGILSLDNKGIKKPDTDGCW